MWQKEWAISPFATLFSTQFNYQTWHGDWAWSVDDPTSIDFKVINSNVKVTVTATTNSSSALILCYIDCIQSSPCSWQCDAQGHILFGNLFFYFHLKRFFIFCLRFQSWLVQMCCILQGGLYPFYKSTLQPSLSRDANNVNSLKPDLNFAAETTALFDQICYMSSQINICVSQSKCRLHNR